jgi:hypothetical protein
MTWIPPFEVHEALRLMVRESLIAFLMKALPELRRPAEST